MSSNKLTLKVINFPFKMRNQIKTKRLKSTEITEKSLLAFVLPPSPENVVTSTWCSKWKSNATPDSTTSFTSPPALCSRQLHSSCFWCRRTAPIGSTTVHHKFFRTSWKEMSIREIFRQTFSAYYVQKHQVECVYFCSSRLQVRR